MEYYKRQLEVDVHDIDINGVARASALMRYIQSAAQYQLTDNGMSYDMLKKQSRAFILSRIKIEFLEPIRAYEPLTAITYPCESRGYSFLRCYKLKRDEKTVARAASIWALIDTGTHALVRVNDFDLGLATYTPLDIAPGRIVMPSEMNEVGKYPVTYGMIDQNRHMNNTTYPDMYASFLPMESRMISSISINFSNEAPMGDTLTVLRGEKDGIYYFKTLRNDGKINTEAEIHLAQI